MDYRRKSHKEWRGGKIASINNHQGVGVNKLMAQQVEFQKMMMKEILKIRKRRKVKRGGAINTITPTWTQVTLTEVLSPATAANIIFICPKIMIIIRTN